MSQYLLGEPKIRTPPTDCLPNGDKFRVFRVADSPSMGRPNLADTIISGEFARIGDAGDLAPITQSTTNGYKTQGLRLTYSWFASQLISSRLNQDAEAS